MKVAPVSERKRYGDELRPSQGSDLPTNRCDYAERLGLRIDYLVSILTVS